MPAPPNDNFANATPIAPNSGSGWFNNLQSSAEPFEPANNGHTVWFKFTAPANFPQIYLFIDTRQPDNPQNTPYLNTHVQAFTGNALNALTEATYLIAGNQNYAGGGYAVGSYIIIPAPAAGSTVYIRVDCIASLPANQREGYFQLKWGPSAGVPNLGKCGQCLKSLGMKVVCEATLLAPNLTTGDIRGGIAYAVSRQQLNLPGGKYMLRFCEGYYNDNNNAFFTQLLTREASPFSFGLIFANNVGANWTFSPVGGSPAAGDYSVVTTVTDLGGGTQFEGQTIVTYYDGSQNHLSSIGGITGEPNPWNFIAYFDGPGPPITTPVSGILNPCKQAITGDAVSYPVVFSTPSAMQAAYQCESTVFGHTGGAMSWVFAIQLGGVSFGVQDGYNVNVAPYVPAALTVGPAGPPSYTLQRILPDLTLVSTGNTFNLNGNPNGAVITVQVQNHSIVSWDNVTWTAAGFFTVQDPNSGGPIVITLQPGAITTYQKSWNMTNPVGNFTLTLTDALGSPLPQYNIAITPLFNCAASVGSQRATFGGKPCALVLFKLNNIGNGTTLAIQTIATATVAGQPIQIIDQNQNLGSSYTWIPHFGNGNPAGAGWDPGAQASFGIWVPLTGSARQVVFNLPMTDSGNTFPPIQVTVNLPAS